MKKLSIILFPVALIMFLSCKKEEVLLGDNPPAPTVQSMHLIKYEYQSMVPWDSLKGSIYFIGDNEIFLCQWNLDSIQIVDAANQNLYYISENNPHVDANGKTYNYLKLQTFISNYVTGNTFVYQDSMPSNPNPAALNSQMNIYFWSTSALAGPGVYGVAKLFDNNVLVTSDDSCYHPAPTAGTSLHHHF